MTAAPAIRTVRVGPAPYIAVDHAGDGDLVIFLHGIGGNRSNWADQIAAFSGRYLAAAWDARGWGDSDDYDGPLSFADVADDLARVLDHFGKKTAHVVGLSMGGFIALEVFARHRPRIRSLTLVDTLASFATRITEEQKRAFVESRKAPLLAGKPPRDIAGPVAASLTGRRATPETVRRLEESMARLHPQSYMKAVDAVVNFDRSDVLDTIDVPVLAIVGSDDRLTNPAEMRRMAGAIRGATFVEIEGAGHLANMEAPREFNGALADFLAGFLAEPA